MAYETHGFIQVPPDGAGKRLTHSVMIELRIGTVTGTPYVGEQCSFGVTTLGGTISEVEQFGGADYDLHLTLEDPIGNNVRPVIGEPFFQNGIQIGLVNRVGELFYTPQSVLVGGNNLVNHLHINTHGSAQVTYPQGDPGFDAFGHLQVSQQHTIASYMHRYDTLDALFTSDVAGSGAYSHLPASAGVLVSTGTDAGARVTRTTDEYHAYQPGISQILMFTASAGDAGKVGLVRRAGVYDDDNGLFFEMEGPAMYVVLRSKSTGTVVEHRVPATEWNTDRMNGAGGVLNPSGFNVDITKDNLFWIDYQWLGAGTVRFGVFVNGIRQVVHAIHHTNVNSISYMSTGTLPFRYEQFNTAAVASSSEMRIFCSTIKTEGKFNPRRVLTAATSTIACSSTTPNPVIAIRPTMLVNGINNRSSLYMYSISAYNDGNDPVMVELRRGAAAVGGAWTPISSISVAESNTTSTGFTVSDPNWMMVVPPKQRVEAQVFAYDEHRQGFRRRANINNVIEQVLTARLLTAGTGGNVTVVMQWDEVRN